MRKLVLIVLAIIMVSCAPKGATDKKAELQEYKDLVSEYSEKIEILQNELDTTMDASEVIRSTSVEVKIIENENFSSFFETHGTVEAMRDVFISPEINGQIKAISVNRGERVRKGDLLIRLNTDITQKSIEELKISLQLSTKLFEKQEELWKQNIGSELQYLESKNGKDVLEARLSSLETQLKMAYIKAPFDGIVEDIMVKTGELASPGMRLLRLVNLTDMRITSQISESFLNKVHVGEMIDLKFSSYPDEIFNVPITRIGTVIDPITRTFTAEVLFDNRSERIKPNMLSSLRIQDYSDDSALVVPSIIMKEDFTGTFVFRVNQSGSKAYAEKVYVTPGRTVQDNTKIEKGISKGDKLIVKGYNLVSEGTPVSIVN